ncbi:replication initiation protein [Cetobacterium sp. 2A]|uniref:replication initiation protein n=1 Tax=Cetobacterium sp. 2A TaxID=2754723 RepID=UPI00163BCF6F|nr:replication initiation protein [Cetobacterium sp. 2A]MBC2855391.1 replication initiation protein [Cetobacterium sp. 2A]
MKSLEVKYSNVMNNVSFAGFKEKELDLFFSICFKLKEYGTDELTLEFDELRELSNYQHRGLERFYKDLDQVYRKLIELNFKYEDDEKIIRFVLFNRYEINKKNKVVSVKVNEDFKNILNDLTKMYTKFDLLDFVNLKSVYSKNTFKLLKQWEGTKSIDFQIENLREILGVPISYNMDNFNKRVLKPLEEELPHCFKNLKIEKIRTGRKITNINFSWERNKEKEIAEIVEIEISSKLNKAIDKAKQNRYLKDIFTEKNIHKLSEKFKEDNLIKALHYAYKTVKQEVPNFSYFLKIIESGTKETQIKIKINKEEIEILKIEDKLENVVETLKSEEQESDLIYKMFLNMPDEIKTSIMEKAKDLFLKEIGADKMNSMYEKFFSASEKKLILKVIRESE